jgi:hypothetical protein
LNVLDQLSHDVTTALDVIQQSNPGGPSPQLALVVASGLVRLRQQAVDAFEADLAWPLALRFLCFDDGPPQYVQRVAFGSSP